MNIAGYYQVKLFKSNNIAQLQDDLNEFLREVGKNGFEEIKFSATESKDKSTSVANYLAAVVYTPRPNMGNNKGPIVEDFTGS
jgi:hypothetical protein